MLREIRKKMVILGNRLPFAPEVAGYIDQMEKTEWIYMNLRLDGSPLSKENVEGIMRGEVVMTGRIMDHVLADRLDEMFRGIYRMAAEKRSISENLLAAFAGEDSYRKSTPTIMEYSYTPPLPSEVADKMRKLCALANKDGDFDNPFLKAALLHNRLIEIYPFRDGNQVAARALLEYYLVSRGFPMAGIDMSESDYNRCICHYLQTGDSTPLAEHITGAVYRRLELMIQLTAY